MGESPEHIVKRHRRHQPEAGSHRAASPHDGCRFNTSDRLATRYRIRTRLVRTVLVLTVALCLANCGSPATPPTATQAGPTPTVTVPLDLPVVVSIVGSFDGQTLAVLDQQISAFEAANPNILVEVVESGGTTAERREEFGRLLSKGDSSYDIYVIAPHWLAEFSASGWLRPLGGLLRAHGLDLGAFLPPAAKASTIDGQPLALPWTADAGLLYYRQDLLDNPPTSWSELEEISLAFASAGAPPYGYVWQAATDDDLTCHSLEFVWAYGGDVLDAAAQVVFDSPQTRSGLQQIARLIELGVSPGAMMAYTEETALEAFQSGQALMMRNGAFAWGQLNAPGAPLAGRVGIAPLPASCLGGQSLGLSASSLYPEQAFEFMAFLTAHEQQAQLALAGGMLPVRETVYLDPTILAEVPPLVDLYGGLLVAEPRPKSQASAALSETIATEVQALLSGEQDIETTVIRIQRHLERMVH